MEDKIYNIILNNKNVDNFIYERIIDKSKVEHIKSNLMNEFYGFYETKNKLVAKRKVSQPLIDGLMKSEKRKLHSIIMRRLNQLIYLENKKVDLHLVQIEDEHLNNISEDNLKYDRDLVNEKYNEKELGFLLNKFDKITSDLSGKVKDKEIGLCLLYFRDAVGLSNKQVVKELDLQDNIKCNHNYNKRNKTHFIKSFIKFIKENTDIDYKAIKKKIEYKQSLIRLINHKGIVEEDIILYKGYLTNMGLNEYRVNKIIYNIRSSSNKEKAIEIINHILILSKEDIEAILEQL